MGKRCLCGVCDFLGSVNLCPRSLDIAGAARLSVDLDEANAELVTLRAQLVTTTDNWQRDLDVINETLKGDSNYSVRNMAEIRMQERAAAEERTAEVIKENTRLAAEWQQCHDVNNDYAGEHIELGRQLTIAEEKLKAAEEKQHFYSQFLDSTIGRFRAEVVRAFAEWLDKKVNIEGAAEKWPCFQHGADLYLSERKGK